MAEKASNLLIVGLGNIGTEYNGTRHNSGFQAVDFLAKDEKWKKEKNYLVAKTGKVIFIKPATFMNLSGNAVLAAMAKYKVSLENIIVIHDDIDLQLGDLRIKIGGGNAGHNGLKSITTSVGNDYRRFRIGVGRPDNENIEVSDWVLGHFNKQESKIIASLISEKIPEKLDSIYCTIL